jgi:DDE superfamily endonuclease
LALAGLSFYREVRRMQQNKKEVHWMEDGAKYHNTKANHTWRMKNGFASILWPAQSPDLNPIENVWAIIKRRISRKRHKIKNTKDIVAAVKKEWEFLTVQDYIKCIDSMKKRVHLCIKAKGGPIKY